jgi:hypothetical protein
MSASSEAIAASIRSELGLDTTGLPLIRIMPRYCPGPGVSISWESNAVGSSPNNSGALLTRVRNRPVRIGGPKRGVPWVLIDPLGGLGNIAPPTRSRLPVRVLSTSTIHDAIDPKRVVAVPMRP